MVVGTSNKPIEFAHRGSPSSHPENSVEGFVAAMEKGAAGIELDVRLAADGVPVVIHDDNLLRTHGTPELVSELDSGSLGKLNVPTLTEIVDLLEGKTRILVELKGEDMSLAKTVGAMCGGCEDVWFLSFCLEQLQALQECAPARPRVLNLAKPLNTVAKEKYFLTALSSDWRLLQKEEVQKVQAGGHEVWAFTCNTPDEKEIASKLGVDAYFTDCLQ